MHNLNQELFLAVNALVSVSFFWDMFFFVLTTGFGAAIFILIVSYVVIHRHRTPGTVLQSVIARYRELFTIGISLVLTWGLVQLLKVLYAIPRPFLSFHDITVLLTYGANDSFPSGHSAMFAALATSIFPYHRWLSLLVAFLALLIGFSRIYVGVHYPLDVLAGFCIGILVSLGIRRLFKSSVW